MPTTSNHSPLSVAYARSLLELAGDRAVEVGQELGDLRQIVEDVPNFAAFLADPGISESERAAVLQRVFKGKLSPLMWNFLGVLNVKGRLGRLAEIAAAYDEMLDEKLGKVEVDLTVARPLSHQQLASAQQKISTALGKDAVLHSYVDDSIIGGMVVRVQDKLLDGSVRAQLQAMKQQLLAKMPK